MKLPRESRTDGRTDGRKHARTDGRPENIASAGAYRRRRLNKNNTMIIAMFKHHDTADATRPGKFLLLHINLTFVAPVHLRTKRIQVEDSSCFKAYATYHNEQNRKASVKNSGSVVQA